MAQSTEGFMIQLRIESFQEVCEFLETEWITILSGEFVNFWI